MPRQRVASRGAPPFIDPPGYAQHRPEATLLYRLVDRHYPALLAAREAAGRPLPGYVKEEFEAYLKCGRLEHGFLRVRCEDCHAEKLVGSAARDAASARAAVHGGWWKVRGSWPTKSCRRSRCGSGWCRSRLRCAFWPLA